MLIFERQIEEQFFVRGGEFFVREREWVSKREEVDFHFFINLSACRLRGRCAADGCGQVRGFAVRHLRGAVHHPAHPHHRGQLQQVGGGLQRHYLVSSTGPGCQNTHQQISHKLLGLCLYPRPKLCFVIKSWRTFPVKTIVYYWCCRLFHALDVCCCLFQLSFQFLLIFLHLKCTTKDLILPL